MTLPQFAGSADAALDAAVQAENCGLDGVFAFDHLWPMGQRGRPALSALPLLGAVAAVTRRIMVGTLVARVGLLPDPVLLGELAALGRIAPGRVIAGLGVGDSKSAGENLACGIPIAPISERMASLAACAIALRAVGTEVWLGGGSAPVQEAARTAGVAVNLWGAEPGRVSGVAATGLEVSWGGPMPGPVESRLRWATSLARAGASWLVWGWPESPETVAEVREEVME